MKIYLIFGCFLFGGNLVAQSYPVFKFDGKEMRIMDKMVPASTILQDDPIQPGEDEWIQLFKNYFHPASLEAYTSFFLPRDWYGLSLENFNQWQSTISQQKLHLQNIFHLKDSEQKEYLIFQYSMESPGYSIFQSTEFKKTASGWKHTSLQNDKASDFLMRIGALDINFYQQKKQEAATVISLDVLQPAQQRTFIEKFNRGEVFQKISQFLTDKGVAQSDIDLARQYFVLKDDEAFVAFIAEKYKLDDIEFMNGINTCTGMSIYNYSRNNNE